MRLLLDECIGDRSLRKALVAAGHDVARSIDELGGGVDDPAVFAFAQEHQRAVITYNSVDFERLSEVRPDHHGVLLIYQDGKPTDTKTSDIVGAISNVEAIYPSGVSGALIVLNGFRR